MKLLLSLVLAAPLVIGALLPRDISDEYYGNESGEYANAARFCNGRDLYSLDRVTLAERLITTCPIACVDGNCVDKDPATKVWSTTDRIERMHPRCEGNVLLTGYLVPETSESKWDDLVERTTCENGCETTEAGAQCMEKKSPFRGLLKTLLRKTQKKPSK